MNWRHLLGQIKITGTALAIVLLVPLVLRTQAAHGSAGAPTMEDVRAESVNGGYRLIVFGELRDRIEREPGRLLLVDTRQDWEHRTGHIPDSINFSFEPTVWSRLKNRWALKEALGADTSRPLVFY
jgi:hypothetical protein